MIQAQKSFALELFEARFNHKNYHSNEVVCRTATENQTLLLLFVETISTPKTNSFLITSIYCYLFVLLSLKKTMFFCTYHSFSICKLGYRQVAWVVQLTLFALNGLLVEMS